jgi:hypothetical protein
MAFWWQEPGKKTGERNPAVLARMRDRRCHATVETIEKALAGNYRAAGRHGAGNTATALT